MINISCHLLKYDMTTADWDAIKYANKILIISFACFATANLHYGLFGELLEGFSLLSICNKPKILLLAPITGGMVNL